MVFYSELRITILILTLCLCHCTAYLCKQIDAEKSNCRCQFDDPSNKVVDFTSISRNDGHPKFPFDGYSTIASDWNYAFNPCFPFNGPSVCAGKAVCQQNKKTPDTVYNLGEVKPTVWNPKDENTITVTYTSSDNIRTSLVSFICDKNAVKTPILEFTNEDPTNSYNFNVKTCLACLETVPGCITSKSNLTTGGVLCIIFTVLVVVYIGGGILFQKFGRGATGKELIPNYAFWSDFPALIKDGFLFMISPCTKNDGYSSI
ncbi:cation-dependent mannose-6-phosphate receptor-like [Lytechinus variegatus]|uniref:cation-dependent mannose-6-phosphate receptor-like n=1 Tax=Lytechinus variegatus TaxID=7654 RepID=UPI001BB10FB8|nr:cation-dependent mannose-6-phosphate receptor-like [Lytechinus variegatus]